MQRRVGVQEDDALGLEVLAGSVEDDLGLVLRGDAGDEARALRLGDAELRSYVLRMSSGRSSQVWACFSVERTKYLMLSKSMPERSAPHVGMGFMPKILSALRRCLQHPLGLALELARCR